MFNLYPFSIDFCSLILPPRAGGRGRRPEVGDRNNSRHGTSFLRKCPSLTHSLTARWAASAEVDDAISKVAEEREENAKSIVTFSSSSDRRFFKWGHFSRTALPSFLPLSPSLLSVPTLQDALNYSKSVAAERQRGQRSGSPSFLPSFLPGGAVASQSETNSPTCKMVP